jgi:hypothetical protein
VRRTAAGLSAVALSLCLLAGSAAAASSGLTAGERSQAKKALLVLSDLPHGWAVNTNGDFSVSGTDVGATQQVARCEGLAPSSVEFDAPEVQSPLFTDASSNEFAENTMLVFRSAPIARQMDAAFTNPKFARCLSASSRQGTTGTTGATSAAYSYARVSSPKGTAAYEATGSGDGVVVTLFVHGQYGDATFVLGSKALVQPLALHLLGEERSRF